MNPNDFAELLDGWTRLRVDMYNMDTGDYDTIFDSDDHPGWCGSITSCVLPTIDVPCLVVTEIGIENDHIVLKCEEEE